MPSFWNELKKRNVVKVAVAYAVIAWLLIEVVATIFPALNLPEWGVTMVIVLLFIGAPVALVLAWAYELTPDGVKRAAPSLSRRQVLIGSASLGALAIGLGAGAFIQTSLRPAIAPSFRRLTFRRGMIRSARFMPDYQTVLYGALWDGNACRVYAVSAASPESAPLDLAPATPLAVSRSGEIAIALGRHYRGVMTYGTLARVPLAGGTPREVMESVKFADWSSDGAELAVVRRVGNHDRLEYPIGTVLAESPPTSGNMAGFSFPRISQDGNHVAFFELTGGLSGSVAVVNRDGTKTTLADGFRHLFGLAWSGEEVWFTAADERPLLRDSIMAVTLDGKVRNVTRLIANGTLHDIAPDGRVLMAHTDDRSGIAVRVSNDVGERDLSWLDAAFVVAISANGEMILFNETGVGGGVGNSVYLRRTDGSPAVRLGDGRALALSPDGHWVLRTSASESSQIDLLPTGPGVTRNFDRPGFSFFEASWLPAGGQVIVLAQEQGRAHRLYVLDLESGELRAITPENAADNWHLSPDGTLVAASRDGEITMYPVAGGPTHGAPSIGAGERLVGWIESGLLVAVDPTGLDLGRIFVMDTASGQRQLWREIQPLDPAGLMEHGNRLVVSLDGQSYAYSWHRALSNLYIVEGLA